MTEREKMLAGQLYDCGDAQLLAQWHKAKDLMRDCNRADSTNLEEKERILNALLGGRGKNLWITAPFYVDYGNNISSSATRYIRKCASLLSILVPPNILWFHPNR